MEILCVVDSVENINHKISMLESLGADIKFFVNSKLVASLIKNKTISKNTKAIYSNNINATIDKYIKDKDYKPTETLLYYSSIDLTTEMLDDIREKLKLKPHTIYIKKKFTWWDKFKNWFYQKIVKFVSGMDDAYASIKLQYFSAEMMMALVETSFKNHIFEIPASATIEVDKVQEKNYYPKHKFSKNYLYNPLAFCLILLCYVVLEKFLTLPFWSYLLVITMLLATIINLIVMIIKNSFDVRYKK